MFQKSRFSSEINNLLRSCLGVGFKNPGLEIVVNHAETMIRNINNQTELGNILTGALISRNLLNEYIYPSEVNPEVIEKLNDKDETAYF